LKSAKHLVGTNGILKACPPPPHGNPAPLLVAFAAFWSAKMTAPIEPATARPEPIDEKQDVYGDAVETAQTAQSPSQSRSVSLLPARWRFWEKWPASNGRLRGGDTDADSAVETSNLTPLPDEAKKQGLARAWQVLWKFLTFMGPGALISVAYIDPDNYQTQIQSGQDFEYKLLFMVLVSNVVAIYLQVRFSPLPNSSTRW
jgi:hypothetical protein